MLLKKQQFEPCMEQLIGLRLRKEYDRRLLSPCFFNLCAEHIMRNAGLDELKDGIKFARRDNNNFRYADDTTLMAENERN